MSAGALARLAVLVFVVAIVQVSALSAASLAGGRPDLLLVVLVAVALLRGSLVGAAAGFAGGLLVDVATLGTLGVTALLLTLAGYWVGRYGETTGRGRQGAALLAVGVMTVLSAAGAYALSFMLGDAVHAVGVLLRLPGALLLNLVLAYPVFAVVRRLVGSGAPVQRAREVELLV